MSYQVSHIELPFQKTCPESRRWEDGNSIRDKWKEKKLIKLCLNELRKYGSLKGQINEQNRLKTQYLIIWALTHEKHLIYFLLHSLLLTSVLNLEKVDKAY